MISFMHCVSRSVLLSRKNSLTPSVHTLNIIKHFNISRTTPRKRKFHYRGGKKKITCLFWNVHGRNQLTDFLASDNFLDRSSISFLSETWITTASSILPNKDIFVAEAIKPCSSGRPSGGLEFYVNSKLCAKLILKTPQHINIFCNNIHFIGVYYKPSIDFCDLLSDLQLALNACLSPFILLCGDFNIHYGSSDFSSLLTLLFSYNLSLRSDPHIDTFYHKHGSSTLDYVFASRPLSEVECVVLPRSESDHFPFKISLKVERHSLSFNTFKAPWQRLSYKECSVNLNKFPVGLQIPNFISTSDPDSSASLQYTISEFINNCFLKSTKSAPIFKPKYKPWFTDFLKSLKSQLRKSFKISHSSPSHINKTAFQFAKLAYIKNCRLAKSEYKLNVVQDLVFNAKQKGISALYKTARKIITSTPIISLSSWRNHCSNLFNTLPLNPPTLYHMPLSQEAYNLLEPFSIEEIELTLASFRSKAKAFCGLSPFDLKHISSNLSFPLKLVLDHFLSHGQFPASWLDLSFFFLHKKGSLSSPDNYRSIAIENPFLKTLSTLLGKRLSSYVDYIGLLPSFQFGFRKNYSSVSAITVLQECIHYQLSIPKGKLFACFFDFKKAFDFVDRSILTSKLSSLGIPHSLCLSLYNLLNNLHYRIRSNGIFSSSFTSSNGLPQGDPISPLLFNLFIQDLPSNFSHQGILLHGKFPISYLQYADDLVLLASSPNDLQLGIDSIARYCLKNNLIVNTDKTKCEIFYKGRCSIPTFTYENTNITITNRFNYLGIFLTTRLSSTPHVDYLLSKASSRLSYLRTRIPIRDLPLPVALCLFDTYILPMLTYGLHLWLPNISSSSEKKLNSFFTKFLKYYLCIPYSANNSITHFITHTFPLSSLLKQHLSKSLLSVKVPPCLSGLKFHSSSLLNSNFSLASLDIIPDIPSWFWISRPIPTLPTNKHSRRALCYDSYDLFHSHMCSTKKFHIDITTSCYCSFCSSPMSHFHHYTCSSFQYLSSSQILSALTS